MKHLRSHEVSIVVNALRLAAERYKECAATCRAEVIEKGLGIAYLNIAHQFDTQEAEALALAEALED